MPDTLFLQILNMSFTASVVILFVLLARLLLKKVPKIFSYALWGVVLFRLVCPFSFESAISLLPTNTSPIPSNIMYAQVPQIYTGISEINNSVNAILPAATPNDSMNPLQGWIFIGCCLWLAGIAALLLYIVVSLLKLRRKLKDAMHEGGNVYTCASLASPFVMGLFRPKIYLPTSLTAGEKQYILLHEQTHIKRLDHVVKLISFFVLCLHWFNPLAWVAFFFSGRDMELSCDEAIIKKLGNAVKKDYSSLLLTLATGKRIVGGTPLAFGEGDTKSRIENVLNYKKPAFWVVAVAIIAVVAVGIGLAANPKSDRAAMQWAKSLRVGDIASVELVTTYGDEGSRYRLYAPEQFPDIIKLVNGSRGKYLPQPEPIAGSGMTLYITTLDGVRHYVCNNGNVYLEIDGDSFQMSRFAVDGWGWYNSGNAAVPEAFGYNLPVAPTQWDLRPMVMVDGVLYLDTGKEVAGKVYNRVDLGEITSAVGATEKPTENGQCNFDSGIGTKYAADGDGIAVFLGSRWFLFEEEPNAGDPLELATHNAIMEYHKNAYYPVDFACESTVVLATEAKSPAGNADEIEEITVYAMVLYQEYDIDESGITGVGGSHIPSAITFYVSSDGSYRLKEYWLPRDGSYHTSDIKARFPENIVADAIDTQKFISKQQQSCDAQAAKAANIKADNMLAVEYSIAKHNKNGDVLAAYSPENQQLAEAILINALVKSAAWEGLELSTLDEYYHIRWTTSQTQPPSDYYAFLLPDGASFFSSETPVLQGGADGMYSVLSEELYAQLVTLFEATPVP